MKGSIKKLGHFKGWLLVTIIVLLALSFVASGQSAPSSPSSSPAQEQKSSGLIVMRIGAATNNDPNTEVMEQFKKEVESKTQKIKIELYPACQLGSNAQMLQNVQAGSLQGLVEPSPFLGGFQPGVTVINIPFLWPDLWTALDVLNSPAGQSYNNYFGTKGIALLGVYAYGPHRAWNLKFQVNDLSSFKGKKIRILGAQVLKDEVTAMGGAPIPMDVPELYTALQQGTIDGMGVAPVFVRQGKYYEVAKNLFITEADQEIEVFMVNKQWLENLPPDLKTIVNGAAAKIQPAIRQYADKAETEAINIVKQKGGTVQIASPELNQQLKTATAGIADNFLKQNPDTKPIYDALKKAIKEYKNKKK